MTTRRKIWMGVGLAALAGTTVPILQPSAAHASRFHAPQPAAAIANATAHQLLEAQAGEGGEGGEGGIVPESYALPSDDPNAYNYDAADVIAAYARGVEASYVASATAAKEMAGAIGAFLAEPNDATLAVARKAWVVARPAYLVTEAFRFYDGPIEAIEGQINAWPLNEAFIDYVVGNPNAGIINNGSEISIAQILIKNAASDEFDVTMGWHAIEFLLWGQDLDPNGPGNRPAADYIPGKVHNDRRREYLKIITDRLVSDLDRLVVAWKPGSDGNYAAKLQAMPGREAVGRIINGVAVLASSELMSDRMAVGLDSGDQEDEQSCFSDTTHQDFVYDVRGIQNVWTGKYPGVQGPGLRDLVARVDPATATELDALLADTVAKIAKLGDPWDQVLAFPPGSPAREDAEAAVTALGKLAEGLKKAGAKLGVLVQIAAS